MKTTLLSISTWLVLACSLTAGESALQVITASEDMLESHPRRIVTSVFFVTNWSEEEEVLTPEVRVPQGWQLIASDRSLRLAPGQREMSLVSFLIPGTARAGSYTVGHSVRWRNRAVRSECYPIRVHVGPLTR